MEQTLEPWLVDAVLRRAKEFGDQLRGVTDGAIRVPNLKWSVADLGRHVAALPTFWQQHNVARDRFERPDDFAAYSDRARAHLTETQPAVLAALVESEFADYLVPLQHATGPVWLYGYATTPTILCGIALNELILHGRDLAAVTGAKAPEFERREANAAVDAVMVTTATFVDHDKARDQPDGVYHVRLRGGNEYTWTKAGGDLQITPGRPKRADAHLIADPATFLLASLGRTSQVRSALSGKMVTYGLRPWRFLGLGKIVVDGV